MSPYGRGSLPVREPEIQSCRRNYSVGKESQFLTLAKLGEYMSLFKSTIVNYNKFIIGKFREVRNEAGEEKDMLMRKIRLLQS